MSLILPSKGKPSGTYKGGLLEKELTPLIRIEGTYINHLKDFKDTPF